MAEVDEWIESRRKAGESEEKIKHALEERGWKDEDIDKEFHSHDKKQKMKPWQIGLIIAAVVLVIALGVAFYFFATSFISVSAEPIS